MSMELNESTRAIYYHHFAHKADIMVMINEKEPGVFTSHGRLRYYMEDTGDAFADKDKKFWFEASKPEDTLLKALESIKGLSEKARAFAGPLGAPTGETPHISVRGDESVQDFFEKFRGLSFVHTKVMDA